MTETYVCPHCAATQERPYRVRLIILTCPECGENGRHVHASYESLLNEVPEDDKPDEWDRMPLDERLFDAMKRGLVDV
ncbi:hypothetical protein [Halogeometricum limi]|uniref:Uncharacterized protein n=1 Tax=Halogeometricum limi TaxID=555875 RepID=A0A1I6IRQ1_9EURY|nr:hypothetical protein [Halogeometricum limi]SFR69398.1 hypothetical protein SAMN04488124_3585 [Halogeometricum limi]